MSVQSVTKKSYTVVLDTDDLEKLPEPVQTRTRDVALQTLSSRSPSPVSSDSSVHSVYWEDRGNLTSRTPADIFDYHDSWITSFYKKGYEATESEKKEIYQKASTGPHGGIESHSGNFAVAKLAMKQLNPTLFWQSVRYVNREAFEELEIAVEAFRTLLKSAKS